MGQCSNTRQIASLLCLTPSHSFAGATAHGKIMHHDARPSRKLQTPKVGLWQTIAAALLTNCSGHAGCLFVLSIDQIFPSLAPLFPSAPRVASLSPSCQGGCLPSPQKSVWPFPSKVGNPLHAPQLSVPHTCCLSGSP